MQLFAYTDEAGNSGLKLFDSGQDAFWTGTLIAYADVDTRYTRYHRELLDLAGVTELHGAELGFGRIERIAARIVHFIREKKLRFAFSRVHKPHLAATKLFDLVFDSGTNRAVDGHVYAVQQLRLVITLHFVQLLEEADTREFWEIFRAQDAVRFGALLGRLMPRFEDAPFDERSLQIITEALKWGSQHPAEILDPFGEGDSPNFVAFSGLFGQLHTIHNESGDTIARFVHDEQNQFVPIFRRGWKLLAHFEGRNHPFATVADWKPIESFDCELIEKPSAASFGIQLVDTCMWIVRRVVDNKDKPRGDCAALFRCLAECSMLAHFDLRQLIEQVEAGSEFVMSLPFTDEDAERAEEIRATIQTNREKRLE